MKSMTRRVFPTVSLEAKMLVLLVLGALFPLIFAGRYEQGLGSLILVYVVVAIGQNIVLGYSGQISIAQSALMAISAYCSALLVIKVDVPFPLAALGGLVAATTGGALLGLLTFRVRTHYVLLVSIGFHIVVLLLIINLTDITGGPVGLFPIPNMNFGSWTLKSPAEHFYVFGVVTVLLFYLAERIRLSRIGLAMFALKNNERGARASGVDPIYYRTLAMALAGFYAGVGGVMFAFLIKFLGPESFSLNSALLYILSVVLGGMGNNWGIVVTVVGLTILQESLKIIAEAWVLLYGLLIMVVIAVAPGGLPELVDRFMAWRRDAKPPLQTSTPQ